MPRILIIDDDRHMRTACERVLTKAGYAVTCCEAGDEGIRKIKDGPEVFDAILLDQLMPGMSGMDVLAQIKILAPELPVIIITGSVTEEFSAEILQKGADGCLPKPFNPEELRTAVRKALE
ncbi:MAG: response regulator [Acidobacteria bacterium]|nr:response regulator [Acidobacteriota bacterium]